MAYCRSEKSALKPPDTALLIGASIGAETKAELFVPSEHWGKGQGSVEGRRL